MVNKVGRGLISVVRCIPISRKSPSSIVSNPLPHSNAASPSSRSLDILKDHFQHDVLEKQDPWSDSDKASVLLNQIPDPSLREALRSLDQDRAFLKAGGVFDDDMIDAFIELKMAEVLRFEMTPHPVEFDMYYSV
mgnify:CR=1 FL=1